jgi:hypothetical protein
MADQKPNGGFAKGFPLAESETALLIMTSPMDTTNR